MRRLALAALLPLALAACVEEAPPPREVGGEDACGAAALQHLVGQPASALDGVALPASFRLIRPGMAVTMDYSAERLNVLLDDSDVIEAITCG